MCIDKISDMICCCYSLDKWIMKKVQKEYYECIAYNLLNQYQSYQ